MRTQEEILARIEEIKDEDFFGFQTADMVGYLTFENAKQFLKKGVTKDDWKSREDDYKDPKDAIIDYLPFAWDKANNMRGLSAGRSLEHFIAWAWLSGDEEFHKELVRKYDNEYQYYGKDILVWVSEQVGFDHTKHDDGYRVNSESEYEELIGREDE